MSDPLITPDDLGVYLNDATINQDRAELMIRLAQTLCESILSPLPVTAEPIVMRIAARGYTSSTGTRGAQVAAAGSPFGATPGGASGVYVTSKDEYDLGKLDPATSGVAAFTIHTRPSGSSPRPWDAPPECHPPVPSETDWAYGGFAW